MIAGLNKTIEYFRGELQRDKESEEIAIPEDLGLDTTHAYLNW